MLHYQVHANVTELTFISLGKLICFYDNYRQRAALRLIISGENATLTRGVWLMIKGSGREWVRPPGVVWMLLAAAQMAAAATTVSSC